MCRQIASVPCRWVFRLFPAFCYHREVAGPVLAQTSFCKYVCVCRGNSWKWDQRAGGGCVCNLEGTGLSLWPLQQNACSPRASHRYFSSNAVCIPVVDGSNQALYGISLQCRMQSRITWHWVLGLLSLLSSGAVPD